MVFGVLLTRKNRVNIGLFPGERIPTIDSRCTIKELTPHMKLMTSQWSYKNALFSLRFNSTVCFFLRNKFLEKALKTLASSSCPWYLGDRRESLCINPLSRESLSEKDTLLAVRRAFRRKPVNPTGTSVLPSWQREWEARLKWSEKGGMSSRTFWVFVKLPEEASVTCGC